VLLFADYWYSSCLYEVQYISAAISNILK